MTSRYTLTVVGPDGDEASQALPSVTEILDRVLAKPGLHDWYYKTGVAGFSQLVGKYGGKLPPDIKSLHSLMKQEQLSPYSLRDLAAKEGSKVHDAVLGLTKGRKPRDLPNLTKFWALRGWKRPNILAAEQIVYSLANGYAGKVDLVYEEDGMVTLSDIKSGEVRDSHMLQVAMYREAWEQMGNRLIDRLSIIQVPRDGGECSETFVSEYGLAGAVDGIISLYKWLKG